MRFIAIGALSVCCALVGCAHNELSSPASAPPQPAEQRRPAPGSDAGGVGATAPSPAQTHSPSQADRSGSRSTRGSGSASSTPSRSPSTSKDASSQGMTSTKPKPPTAPRNSGNEAEPPAAGAAKPEAPRPATSSTPSGAPAAAKANPAAPAPAAASLNLTSLEQRLKDTRAIGVFTKLSLKNQVDDLLSQFRAFHNRKAAISLSELRQRYDLLLLKVLSLLQDGDPPLANAISSSREALWGILSDPQKFAKL